MSDLRLFYYPRSDTRRRYRVPSELHAQPGPTRQVLFLAMQLSPQALPFEQVLQHGSAFGAGVGLGFDAPKVAGGGAPSPQTVHSRLSPLRGLYSRAVTWGLVDRDPTTGVRRPKVPPPIPRGLTIAQVRAFMGSTFLAQQGRRLGLERAVRNRAAFAILFLTALRLTEVTRLTVGHFQEAYKTPDAGAYLVVRTKGAKVRKVFFPPPVLAVVNDYIAASGRQWHELDPAASIWLKHSGSALREAVKETARAAGIGRVTTHQLRHSAAQIRHAAAKMRVGPENALENVSQFLGHSALSTTDRYLKKLDPELDECWEDAAKLIGF